MVCTYMGYRFVVLDVCTLTPCGHYINTVHYSHLMDVGGFILTGCVYWNIVTIVTCVNCVGF